jgi:GntR family transcriptional regulator, transcriptional repressor for pyruvate dehydrogenase complex
LTLDRFRINWYDDWTNRASRLVAWAWSTRRGLNLGQPRFEPVRLSEQVHDQILALITGGEFPVKAKLPTEIELAARFEVSRTIVREALVRLRDDGIVVSRQGAGTFVKRHPDRGWLKLSPLGSIADIQRCFEFRTGFEADMTALAARRANRASIKRIGDAVEAFEAIVQQGKPGSDADFHLHCVIAEATQNRFFVSVMTSLREHITFGMTLARSLSRMHPAARIKAAQDEHRLVFEAVRARDPDRAREAMRFHIEQARLRVFEGEMKSAGQRRERLDLADQ